MTRAQGSDIETEHQRIVDRHFQVSAPFWTAIYEGRDIHAAIHQERRALVLSLVAELGIARDSRVLEVGCGAGLTAASLAERYLVEAVNTVQEMLNLTHERAVAEGVAHRLTTRYGDANNLPFSNGAFDLVIAIGVLPWLRDTSQPLREFTRVLRSGGYVIVNIDSAWALQRVLDPQLNPVTQQFKQIVRRAVWRLGLKGVEAHVQLSRISKFDRLLTRHGLSKVRSKTLGFGPFSLFDHAIVRSSAAQKLHRTLQRMADRGVPIIRSAGAQYLVVARKPQ